MGTYVDGRPYPAVAPIDAPYVVTAAVPELIAEVIATATPGANAVPKADGAGKFALGWLSEVLGFVDLTDVDAQAFATGDLLYRSGAGKWVRLPIGNPSDLLKVVSGLPVWGAGGGGGITVSTTNIAFTDGDTLRRVTITDAAVAPGSKILGAITRPSVADVDDPGYIYVGNIVRRQAGSFDFLVACLDWGFDDPIFKPPNETIELHYTVQ